MDRKEGAAMPLSRKLGPRLIRNNVAWTKAQLHAKCHRDPSGRFATIDMGQKLGGSVPFWGGGWVPIYLDLSI